MKHDTISKTNDNVVVESPLQININNSPYTVVMRTPGEDYDLVRGLLFAEDIYKKEDEFNFTVIKKEKEVNEVVNVTISKCNLGSGYLNKRTLLSVSSCGICGKTKLEDLHVSGDKISSTLLFSLNDLEQMQAEMVKYQKTFQKTGGCHAAAIFNRNKELLTVKEDIGRHNAVDKCVGNLVKNKLLKSADFLFVSGRVSYEIISKAFISKITVIVAVSAVSSLAIDFAKEFGVCLIGFKRNDKMTLYSKPSFLNILEDA